MILPGKPIAEMGSDPRYAKGKEMETFVTAGVDFLRSKFPHFQINHLMRLVWDLIGHKVTPFALGPAVPTLSFGMICNSKNPTITKACIFAPEHWLEMIADDKICQMGALVYVGSQCCDFYHGKCVGPNLSQEMIARSSGWEAEYLMVIKQTTPDWRPNPYQADLLANFPNGLQSDKCRDLRYPIQPFVKSSTAN